MMVIDFSMHACVFYSEIGGDLHQSCFPASYIDER